MAATAELPSPTNDSPLELPWTSVLRFDIHTPSRGRGGPAAPERALLYVLGPDAISFQDGVTSTQDAIPSRLPGSANVAMLVLRSWDVLAPSRACQAWPHDLKGLPRRLSRLRSESNLADWPVERQGQRRTSTVRSGGRLEGRSLASKILPDSGGSARTRWETRIHGR